MLDTKRKGILSYCEECGKKTRHVTLTDNKEKLTWLVCPCGEHKLWCSWS